MDTNSLIQNMISAAKLDVNFFNAVKNDESKNQEALIVVLIAAIAFAIGSFLWMGIITSIVFLIMTVASYYLWAYTAFYIGNKFFEGKANIDSILRTIGYAYSPLVLSVLMLIPCLGTLIWFVASVWTFGIGIVALRETMEFDTSKAIITSIIVWFIIFIVYSIVIAVLGVLGIGGLLSLAAISGQ